MDKPVRIGVNWGSLDQELLAHMMDENAKLPAPKEASEVLEEALVQSALLSAARAEELGMGRDKIILSCKVSDVQAMVSAYQNLGGRGDYALHLGLTEAGMGLERHRRLDGRVGGTAAAGHRRYHPYFIDARARRRPHPRGHRRPGSSADDGHPLLRAAGHRLSGLRPHDPVPCFRSWPTKSRATSAPRCRNGAPNTSVSKR